jgi:hypothetical protein
MRPFALLITLATFSAFAQPHVGDEIPSAPIPISRSVWSAAQPAVAMATDRDGVAIAWSMPDERAVERVYVARLDAQGHVNGVVRQLPTLNAQLYAFAPSMARSLTGSGFTIAWIEAPADLSTTAKAAFAQLDATLNPSLPQALFDLPKTAPIVVRTGTRTWVTGGGSVSEITRAGATSPLGGLIASDMTVANDYPQIVSRQTVAQVARCACDPGPHAWGCTASCPAIYVYSYSLQFMSLYTFSAAKILSFASDAQPAISSDGQALLIAWMNGAQTTGGDVVVARLDSSSLNDFSQAVARSTTIGTFNRDAGETRPDIASDGNHTVVVWRTRTDAGDHDVVGAAIDHDGRVTSFSIAASAGDERDPSIVALSNGTFLVAYEKIEHGERHIAGRFLTFDERRRAAR